MGNTNWSISKESATSAAYHDPEGFSHATKVCAMKHCRHPRAGDAASLAHAGKPIADHFGVNLRGLSRVDERERSGCDDPMNGLHDHLPLCGRRDAPARRRMTRNCDSAGAAGKPRYAACLTCASTYS